MTRWHCPMPLAIPGPQRLESDSRAWQATILRENDCLNAWIYIPIRQIAATCQSSHLIRGHDPHFRFRFHGMHLLLSDTAFNFAYMAARSIPVTSISSIPSEVFILRVEDPTTRHLTSSMDSFHQEEKPERLGLA